MTTRRTIPIALILFSGACSDPLSEPAAPGLTLHRNGHDGDRIIIVDPRGRHDATTIQAGIDLVTPGGRVQVKAGTYNEVLVIAKGLTLEAYNGGHDDHHRDRSDHQGTVIISPPGTPTIGVQITTPDPVTIRDVDVHFSGLNGIQGTGAVDLTVEDVSVLAVNPPVGRGYMLSAVNEPATIGARARLVVRESFLDGSIDNFVPGTAGIAMMFGIAAQGDVDASFADNVVRRTGGACVLVLIRADGKGETNANILHNDLDLCHPTGRVASVIVGAPAALPASQLTVTGVVNLIGNVIRNSSLSCLPTDAIVYEFGSGVIEHNRILQASQACATPSNRSLPGGIWIGSTRSIGGVPLPPASPVVRFNDIVGNAQAGLRIGPNQTTILDARCNYWGSTDGPSGTGLAGTGDAIVVEAGAASPASTPFATEPVARRRHDGHRDHHNRGDRDGCRIDFSLWSDPVSLGTTINTAANEQGPSLSEDGRTLYFGSDRTGGSGSSDIWVARRACRDCAWDAPINVGSTVNSSASETGPSVSLDGHLLFFTSTRAGGPGGQDIYVSYRANTGDDLAWGPPVSVGPEVNTAAFEAGAEYLLGTHGRASSLFFNRSPAGGTADIYVVPATAGGLAAGPAVLVSELSDPVATDQGTTLRGDGREAVFFSTRTGGLGGNDLWTSIRRSVRDPWSTPVNLAVPINTSATEQQPSLSGDGRTLVFASSRTGSLGGTDIWMATRTRIGR